MEKINKENVITAVNIGSSRITACIANIEPDNNISIIGLGRADGKFTGKKGVLDIDVLSNAMRYSIKAAEQEAGIEVSRAFVGVTGAGITSEKSRGMARVGKKGEEIATRHIRNVLRVAEAVPLGVEREIIHSIPQSFIVDGQDGIKNPIGLYGMKLEVEALLIAVDTLFIQNIIKCLNIAGVELEETVFSGIAASFAVSHKEEAQGGIVLIEQDNSFTSLSVFFEGVLKGVEVCGMNIIQNGVLESLMEAADKIRGARPISKIIVAGTSFLPEGIVERIETIFRVPAEIAYPRNIKGPASDINNPAYITAMGLAGYGASRRLSEAPVIISRFGFLNRAVNRLKALFAEYF